MLRGMKNIVFGLLFGALASLAVASDTPDHPEPKENRPMELGAFSVSLAVKDLAASREFYQRLGFEPVGGDPKHNWQILRNGTTTIGLFQGMFEENILTFNPGWDAQAQPLVQFTDVREIQATLDQRSVECTKRADDSNDGPTSLVIVDPDGNPVLIDQHVPRPK